MGTPYLSFHLRTLAAGARDEQQQLSWVQLLSSGPSTRMMCRPRVGSGFMLSIHLDVGSAAAVTGRQQGSSTCEGRPLFSMPEMCGEWGVLGCCPSLLVGSRIFARLRWNLKCASVLARDQSRDENDLIVKSTTLQHTVRQLLAGAMLLSYIFYDLKTTL